jgi:hypothetical protein
MKFLIALCLFFGVLLLCEGCPRAPFGEPSIAIPKVGSALDKTSAYVNSAESAVVAAKPHADAVGAATLDLASKAHTAAQGTINEGKTDLLAVQAERDKLVATSAAAIAAANARAAKAEAATAAMLHSWGHKLQVFVTWAFWVVVALLAIHVLGSVLALILPPPYSAIASIVAKLVNPAAWLVWLLSHIEKNRAVAAAQAAGPYDAQTGLNALGVSSPFGVTLTK